MAETRAISRREFARGAAIAAAAVALPLDLAAQSEKAATPVKPAEPPQAAAGELSSASKAEAQQSYKAVMEKYGERFSDEQKKEIARLLEQQQKSIEAVRKFTLDNGDAPATVLCLGGEENANAAR